jgi:hypothetical protein
MVREVFDIRKRFLGFPMVLCAGWVGTTKHSTMADGGERAEQRYSCCGWMRAIVLFRDAREKNLETPRLPLLISSILIPT